MKNTRKILVAFVLLMAMLVGMFAITSSAADDTITVYLTPNANWKKDNARFAVNYFGAKNGWVSMTAVEGENNLYTAVVPTGVTIIFCRMNPGATANNWNNKWNQTADLPLPTDGTNHYTVAEGAWDKGAGSWSTYVITDCKHENATVEEVAATCTTAGYKKTTCSCGYVNNEIYNALGHHYIDGDCERCDAVTEYTTVYFDNSSKKWGTVYCYTWDASNVPYIAWPGEAMTYDEDANLWSYQIPAGYVNIIFNNNSAQTGDLKVPTDSKVIHNGSSWSCKHSFVAGEVTPPTCTAAGYTTYVCECGATEKRDEVPAAAHTEETIPAVDATCSIDGATAGVKCSVCGEVLTAPTVVPAAHTEETIPAVDATCTTEGATAGVKCSVCGEVLTAPTAVPVVPHTEEPIPAVDPTCCVGGFTAGVKCSVCGTVITEVAPVDATGEHTYGEGCVAEKPADPDPEEPEVEEKDVYVFESSALDAFKDGDDEGDSTAEENPYENLQTVVDNFFTIIFNSKSKIDSSNKKWEIEGYEYQSGQRLYLGGKTTVDGPAIKFTTSGPVTVTLWWVSNGENGARPVGILNAAGEIVCQDTTAVAKNATAVSVFELDEAGTYYLGNMVDNNYFFKVEVAKKAASDEPIDPPACEHVWADATCELPKTCSVCGATEGEALGHTYFYNACVICGAANPNFIINSLVAGENKVVCNEYHLVGDGQNGNHTFPYEFVILTVTEDGTYTISGNMLGVTIFTTEITTEGADWSNGGASWIVYELDGTADLKAGFYYIGLVYVAGVGEYTVNVEKAPEHEHSFVDGECECGEKDPNYVPPHEHSFVDGECECGEKDPNYVPPVDEPVIPDEPVTPDEPADDQNVVELNFFQKLWLAILNFFKKLFGLI